MIIAIIADENHFAERKKQNFSVTITYKHNIKSNDGIIVALIVVPTSLHVACIVIREICCDALW